MGFLLLAERDFQITARQLRVSEEFVTAFPIFLFSNGQSYQVQYSRFVQYICGR